MKQRISAPTITLFAEHVDPSRRPATLIASALIHVGVITLVSLGVLYAPRVTVRDNQHLTVRHLDLRSPQEAMSRAAQGIEYPDLRPRTLKSRAGKAAPHRPSLAETAHARPGPQTLLQPDLKDVTVTENIPVPQVLIWTPPKTVVKNIVAPQPEQPSSAQVKPSPETPNQEINLSDVDLASSPIPNVKLQILPSTTSPVAVHNDLSVQLPPSTVSQVSAQPTPAAVMSLSNLRMEGTATLPPVNESAQTDTAGDLEPSPTKAGWAADNGTGDSSGNDAGAGQGSATGAGDNAAAGRQGRPDGAARGPNHGADTGAQNGTDSATDITLPKSGVFSAVVVGDSLQDEYPELSGVWNGRLAYTVFLHVGLERSWILQYSLPTDTAVKLNGSMDRLEAPWPYNIVRPNLASGAINADALMVHGFVNTAGHFEDLSIVFPPAFPQAQFVLDSLARWQFRPATENGQIARVEVLLIIPEELN